MKKTGRISLVGSGPGDPGLLTLKGQKRIREADWIVYDTLANPQHLVHAKKGAKSFCVGEGFRHRKISQDRVNRMILAAARKGLNIVRLKGGDPCLFGRGGEEALYFSRHGLPFEFVPGVTSATAASAYAGVPLTHRDHNSTVTFVTGHRAQDGQLDSIDWRKIASLDGTIVVYMGLYNLPLIVERLGMAGMPAQTPVLVVQWGTLGRQRSVSGTLDTIESQVRREKLGPPSLIIIGQVVRLRRELTWFEKLPLFGRRVVMTRPGGASNRLHALLSEQGAEALELPVIQTVAPRSWKPVDAAIRRLPDFDWVVFTSSSGVRFFMERLFSSPSRDARVFGRCRLAAIGPETAAALKNFGLRADLLPDQFETRSFARSLQKRVSGQRVLLVRTGLADRVLDKQLAQRALSVTRVDAYRTVIPRPLPTETLARVRSGGADIVTFTSASTVDHFVRVLGARTVRRIQKTTRWASIGPATSRALRRHGLKPWVQARQHTFEGLVEALCQKAKSR